MPFRLDGRWAGTRAKIQFTTSAQMPYLIYQACLKTGTVSNTVYIQHAVVEALARDLNLSTEELLASLPEPRTTAKHVIHPDDPIGNRRVPITEDQSGGVVRIGPANTNENVR